MQNKNKHTSVVTTGSPKQSGLSLRNGFNGYFVLSPVTGLFCHRRSRIIIHKLDASVGASGPHDFAVRQNAARLAPPKRPPHPASTFVTIAKRPSCEDGTGGMLLLIWGLRQDERLATD
jgi:hypothetical protein